MVDELQHLLSTVRGGIQHLLSTVRGGSVI
jgi:hypothetical protein